MLNYDRMTRPGHRWADLEQLPHKQRGTKATTSPHSGAGKILRPQDAETTDPAALPIEAAPLAQVEARASMDPDPLDIPPPDWVFVA